MICEGHPFNYVYPIQNNRDFDAIADAYGWVANKCRTPAPHPQVWVVNHEHMQRAARTTEGYDDECGDVYGWFSRPYHRVYISDKLKPSRHKHHAAIVVHEFVHYVQACRGDEGTREELEREANLVMDKFLLDS